MKKYEVVTLGCRTNQYESQAFATQLNELGYKKVEEGEVADVCIVNTCTVTASADSHSRHAIRQLVRKHPLSTVVVTGCFAEQNPGEVLSIDGVTHVVSNKDKERLLSYFIEEETLPEFKIAQFEAHTRAFVKVQDGCNSFCTYCIIPYVRGRSRSRPVEDVLREVEGLVDKGFKEIVVTGINVGDYDGGGDGKTLADLIRAIDLIPGVDRLRLSSIDPDEVNEDLLDAIVNGKNTCHSMHIVLQAGSNTVLKRMNRKYTRQIFMETVERLKDASPRFTFTTDIIVGFPGETEEDFLETLSVVEQVKFAKVHMFPYSDRPRTRSSLYPNKVSHEVISERKGRLLRMAEQQAFLLRESFVGTKAKVLIEEGAFGHTDNFLEVNVVGEGLKKNQIVSVKLIENHPTGLIGRIDAD